MGCSVPLSRIILYSKKIDGVIEHFYRGAGYSTARIKYRDYVIGLYCMDGNGCQLDVYRSGKLVAECKGTCYALSGDEETFNDLRFLVAVLNDARVLNEFCNKWRIEKLFLNK